MAKSGFVPAWMKIPSSDKTNGNQKLNLDRSTIISGRQRHHSSDIIDHTTTRHTLFYYPKANEQFRHSSNDNHSDMTIKSNDRIEKDFPLLNQRELSSNNNDQSSIWNNASSKFRISNNDKLSRTFASNRFIARKDRLLSTPNNLLQTNCITQTKNLDKRSEFFNSLKNDLIIEGNKNHYNQLTKPITKQTLLLLSVSETSEEKELLIQMGWNDDMTYEITDKDKEEYEQQIKLLPKTDNRSARLISALNRRTLPYINIRDILQLEMIDSASDDDSSDD